MEGRAPGGNGAGNVCWSMVFEELAEMVCEALVPLLPDGPVGKASLALPRQQAVVCSPGYELAIPELRLVSNVLSQGRVVQHVTISICNVPKKPSINTCEAGNASLYSLDSLLR